MAKVKRLVVTVDRDKCIGCGRCVRACLTGALELVDGKAKLVDERLCDGFGSCIAVCPSDAIRLEHREAEGFDWSVVDRMSFDALLNKLRMASARAEEG